MFVKFDFSPRQINNYFNAASRSFKIASTAANPQVVFMFSYDSLIKLAIAVCAKNGLRVKARAGHHIELLEKMSEFMSDKDINEIGSKMRRKRNLDLYDGGIIMSEKEAGEYKNWLKAVFTKAEAYFFGADKLL